MTVCLPLLCNEKGGVHILFNELYTLDDFFCGSIEVADIG